jgi:hypothetical protein
VRTLPFRELDGMWRILCKERTREEEPEHEREIGEMARMIVHGGSMLVFGCGIVNAGESSGKE